MAGVIDEWAAYQFDCAVVWLGTYVENKLNEMDETQDASGAKRYKSKYTLADLIEGEPAREAVANVPSKAEMSRISGITVR